MLRNNLLSGIQIILFVLNKQKNPKYFPLHVFIFKYLTTQQIFKNF